jgi:membrane protein implicated in regulation of membrane protease activity
MKGGDIMEIGFIRDAALNAMENGQVDVSFIDTWAWLIFVAIGLVLILMELLLGIETGLDLVFIGSACILGGLITIAMDNWVWSAVITGIIAILYVLLGRRYVHGRLAVKAEKTNIDTIIGRTGVVLKDISQHEYGLVKIGMEEWRAGADDEIKKGEAIEVTGIRGATLSVKKAKGGNE